MSCGRLAFDMGLFLLWEVNFVAVSENQMELEELDPTARDEVIQKNENILFAKLGVTNALKFLYN